MRIRKNMKLSSLLLATTGYGGETPETYLCQLNQSPWDVIQMTSHGDAELSNLVDSSWFLPSPSSSSSPILVGKVDGEEDNVKVSLGDSNGGLKSSVERINLNAEAEEDYESERSPGFEEPMDQSSDDKKSKSKFVELELDSSDEFSVPKRGRPRGTGKKTPAASTTTTAAANPYEFYYYSGFGPRWGRKRGTGENVIQNEENNRMGEWTTTSFEQDNSDHGTTIRKPKRGRKPVKERSLKSLM